jgi:hypothetical protein
MVSNRPTVRTTRRRLHCVDSIADGAGDLQLRASALDEHLAALVTLLETNIAQEGLDRPHLVRVVSTSVTGDGIDVGIRPVDDDVDGVVEALAGFTAPANWLAIGVAAGANAYALDDVGGERSRALLVHLVTRNGESASVLRIEGEQPRVLTPADAGSTSGRVDDVCRRALALPTPPPSSTLELWALVWLDNLLAASATGVECTPLSWRNVTALHPAVCTIVESEPELGDEASTRLVRLGHLYASIHDWSTLRIACGKGDWPAGGVSPRVAKWLDDGAFSRWVTGSYPPLDELAGAVCELVSAAVARRLRSTLREWGVAEG